MGSEWVTRRIGDIAEVIGGGTPSTKDPSNFGGSIPWLTPKDLAGPHPRYVARGARNLSEKGLRSSSARLLPKNTVLLSTRAPIGYLAIAANPIATSQGFRSLVVKEGIDHEFVYYWLKAHIDELERRASGSTFKELSGSALKEIPIRLPVDRREQEAIARILGSLDDKIEQLRRMNGTLEAIARTIFKSWFVDFDPVIVNALRAGNPIPEQFAARAAHYRENPEVLGLPADVLRLFPDRFRHAQRGFVPDGWRDVLLGDLSEKPQYGYTASARPEPIGPRFLRITDINKGAWITWASVPFCEIAPTDREKYLLRPGDLVIARIADPGHGALIEEEVDAVFASYLIRFRPRKRVLQRYLQYWLRSDAYWRLVEARQSGSTRGNLNAKVLAAFPLLLPGDDVLGQFGDIVGTLRGRVIQNVWEMASLQEMRDAVLPKLISGELRIPDVERILEESA